MNSVRNNVQILGNLGQDPIHQQPALQERREAQ